MPDSCFHLHRILAGVATALALAVPPLSAQAPEPAPARADTVIALPEVVVATPRSATAVGGAGAVEVRVDSLALPPAPTLGEVLREVPFVQVRSNSRGETELSIRGTEGRQVAVLLDGVPLSLGWDHRADLSVIPSTGVRSLTLVRGLSSVLHGPNVLGGVAEVEVGRASTDAEAELRASASADHLGGRAVQAVAGAPVEISAGSLLLRAGAGYRAREAVALPGDVSGAPVTRADDLRENSDEERADAFLSARLERESGAWLSASAVASRAERGVPPELHVQKPRLWRYPERERALAALSGGTGQRRTPLGTGDLEASLGIDLAAAEIESYADRDYTRLKERERSEGRTTTVRLLGDHSLGERGDLRGALTLADIRHREEVEGSEGAEYRQRLASLGAETEWRLGRAGPLSGIRLNGGAALDAADTPESGDKPPLGSLSAWGGRVGASAVLGGGVLLHAGASRRVRFPSLRELYSGALGRFAPNPELRPEALTAAEAGLTTHAGALELQAVAFHHRLSDAIVRAGVGEGRYRRENRDELRSTGAELLLDWNARPVAVAADLALQRVRVLDAAAGTEARAEYQPEVAGGIGVSLPLPARLLASARAEYLGRRWCAHPELGREVALDPDARLDLRLERRWSAPASGVAIRTSLALDNATDEAVFDQCGLPQPGRTLRFQVELARG